MTKLIDAAVAGLAKTPSFAPEFPEGIQASTEGLREKQFLLCAGAWAICRSAGARSQSTERPEPPPREHESFPPLAAEGLIAELLAGKNPILLEILGRELSAKGMSLPPILLPEALSLRENAQRKPMTPVLGPRGRWLASLNPDWKWALSAAADVEIPPEQLQERWEFGLPDERKSAIMQFRKIDPAKARALIEETWSKEKVDFRVELAQVFAINLSADDLPFVATLRSERSDRIRNEITPLLARLGETETIASLTEKAEAIVSIGKDGKLVLSLPEEGNMDFDCLWPIRRLPPSHWEQRFDLSPREIVRRGLMTSNGYFVHSLAHAAALHEDAGWQEAIVEAIFGWLPEESAVYAFRKRIPLAAESAKALECVLESIDEKQRSAYIHRLLEGEQRKLIESAPSILKSALESLGEPWPDDVCREIADLCADFNWIDDIERDAYFMGDRSDLASLIARRIPHAYIAEIVERLPGSDEFRDKKGYTWIPASRLDTLPRQILSLRTRLRAALEQK